MPLKRRKNKTREPVCPIARCMSLLGGAWTPNTLWYLSEGPRRFSELRADMPPISSKVLSAQLRDLEQKGVILRRVLPTSPPSVEYQLTPLGAELLPAIRAIVSVGHRLDAQPAHHPSANHDAAPSGQTLPETAGT
jgi:DNA-binding HxlR family transcriptional regulator